jgi:glucose-6-phosphate dehydrogenase assembly protein OpcA
MVAQSETFTPGIAVEIGKIERELKKLWQEGGEKMTRASLINLAVYSEAPDSLRINTEIVSRVTEDHACRAIVIAANPSADTEQVQAWINAHCHISRAGSKQVCSEQLSFSLAGSFASLLPNIVFSHLDSDLPFYLWWQGEFHDPMDPQLWTWVDRLLYDSRSWKNFETQMRLVETAHEEANRRVVLCDLNWTRLVQLRLALAQFFDHPASHDDLAQIERAEVAFAPGHRSTAVLLVGWLASQLGWTFNDVSDDVAWLFANCIGEPISVSLQEKEGEPVSRCSIFSGAIEYRVEHCTQTDLLETSKRVGGKDRMRQLMPAGQSDPVALMREELMRGGAHRVYLRAVQAVRDLL